MYVMLLSLCDFPRCRLHVLVSSNTENLRRVKDNIRTLSILGLYVELDSKYPIDHHFLHILSIGQKYNEPPTGSDSFVQ